MPDVTYFTHLKKADMLLTVDKENAVQLSDLKGDKTFSFKVNYPTGYKHLRSREAIIPHGQGPGHVSKNMRQQMRTGKTSGEILSHKVMAVLELDQDYLAIVSHIRYKDVYEEFADKKHPFEDISLRIGIWTSTGEYVAHEDRDNTRVSDIISIPGQGFAFKSSHLYDRCTGYHLYDDLITKVSVDKKNNEEKLVVVPNLGFLSLPRFYPCDEQLIGLNGNRLLGFCMQQNKNGQSSCRMTYYNFNAVNAANVQASSNNVGIPYQQERLKASIESVCMLSETEVAFLMGYNRKNQAERCYNLYFYNTERRVLSRETDLGALKNPKIYATENEAQKNVVAVSDEKIITVNYQGIVNQNSIIKSEATVHGKIQPMPNGRIVICNEKTGSLTVDGKEITNQKNVKIKIEGKKLAPQRLFQGSGHHFETNAPVVMNNCGKCLVM